MFSLSTSIAITAHQNKPADVSGRIYWNEPFWIKVRRTLCEWACPFTCRRNVNITRGVSCWETLAASDWENLSSSCQEAYEVCILVWSTYRGVVWDDKLCWYYKPRFQSCRLTVRLYECENCSAIVVLFQAAVILSWADVLSLPLIFCSSSKWQLCTAITQTSCWLSI